MTRWLVAWLVAVNVCTSWVHTQGAAPATAFDVVSVRRQPANIRSGRGISIQPGGRLVAPSVTVRELIIAAYGLQDVQIVGGPEWMATDRFDVAGTTRADIGEREARAMLQTLLAERFRLSARLEQRELPVYLLVRARADGTPGPQLRPSAATCAPMTGPPRGIAAPPFIAAPPPPPAGSVAPLVLDAEPLRCPSIMASMNGNGHWSVREVSMLRFAQRLTVELGRPVIDRTRLQGAYDVDLTFASDAVVLSATAPGDLPGLLTALRDQLGLRLESARTAVDVLAVEHVERPAEN